MTNMKSQFKPLRIFIGCPSDVADKKLEIEKIAESLSSTAEKHGYIFTFLKWENVLPEAGNAQHLILKTYPPET